MLHVGVEEAWHPGIMARWSLDQPGLLHRKSEYGRQAVVRYHGTGDQGWLTVYAHRISGAQEIEDVRQLVEKLDARTNHAYQEHLVDYAIDMVDRPIFPFRLGLGLYTVSEPVGMYSLSDYYDWHNRPMSWKELIAFSESIMPAVASLHDEQIYHGNITADNIFFNAGYHDLAYVALEELPLILGCPYPFRQSLACFPYTAASFLMRTPEQIDPRRFGKPGPHTDIRQLATLLYRKLTGLWPLDISNTPSLQQIADAICDSQKLRVDRLPYRLQSVFVRALGRGPRYQTVKDFGRDVSSAAQECQRVQEQGLTRVFPVRERVSRRQALRVLAAATTVSLIIVAAMEVKSMEDGVGSQQPAPPPVSPVEPLNPPGNHLTSVLSLPGQTFVAGSMTGLLAVYTLGERKPQRSLQLPQASLHGMALSADGQSLVCYDERGYVNQVDASITGQVGKRTRLSQDARALALLNSGVLISDGALVRFFAGALEKPWPAHTPADLQYREHAAAVTGLATVSDGWVVSASMDRTVRIWSAFTGETRCTYDRHTTEVLAVAATAGAGALLLASGDGDGRVDIWAPQGQGVQIDRYQHKRAVNVLAWSADGHYLLSGGDDALVLLYGVQERRIIKRYVRHREPVLAVAWLDDGFVVTMSASEMHIWQTDLEQ